MKARRKEIGIPVDEIAAALGVSVATVYRYENGDIEKLPGNVLEPLANVLRTTPAYLMGWDEAHSNLAAKDLSLADVALEMNLPVEIIERIIRGDAPPETMEVVVQVANLLSAQSGKIKVSIDAREYAILLLYRSASQKERAIIDTTLGLAQQS